MNFISPVERTVSADLKRQYLCLPSIEAVRRDFHATKLSFRKAESQWMKNFLLGHCQYLLWVYRTQRGAK